MPETFTSSGVALDDEAELTEEEVLAAAEGSALSDILQLLYRHHFLQSLRTPNAVDFGEMLSLRILSLSHNLLTDIGPVADLPSLLELNVNSNRISDLGPAFLCEALESLLAANNCVVSIEGIALHKLQRLSLFSNEIADRDLLLDSLSNLSMLRRLDIGGNPCYDDVSQRYCVLRALPTLKELDGESLKDVDWQLADDFFACAQEVGFQERPQTALRARPTTAPASNHHRGSRPPTSSTSLRRAAGLSSPSSPKSASRTFSDQTTSPRASPRHSRSTSIPPETQQDLELPDEDLADMPGTVRRYTSHIEAVRLRIKTVQVDCENLRRQIRDIQRQEPVLGVAALKHTCKVLDSDNRAMHAQVTENEQLRKKLESRQAELARRREALGLQDAESLRPRSARPRSSHGATAACDAVLGLSSGQTGMNGAEVMSQAQLEFENNTMRRRLEDSRRQIGQLRSDTFAVRLGEPVPIDLEELARPRGFNLDESRGCQ